MPKLTHFELAADDTERAVNFYRRVFGWDINSDEESGEDYWLVTPKQDEVEITAGIFPRLSWSDSTINTFEVTSIDGFAAISWRRISNVANHSAMSASLNSPVS